MNNEEGIIWQTLGRRLLKLFVVVTFVAMVVVTCQHIAYQRNWNWAVSILPNLLPRPD